MKQSSIKTVFNETKRIEKKMCIVNKRKNEQVTISNKRNDSQKSINQTIGRESAPHINVTHFHWNCVCVCVVSDYFGIFRLSKKKGNLRINSSFVGSAICLLFTFWRSFFFSFILFRSFGFFVGYSKRCLLNVQLVSKSLFNRASIDNLSNLRYIFCRLFFPSFFYMYFFFLFL